MTQAPDCGHRSWRTMLVPPKRRVVGWWCEKRQCFIKATICPLCKYKPKIEPPRAADNSSKEVRS